MKFYLVTYFFLVLFLNSSLGQNNPTNQSSSELPKLNTESLQIETVVELYPNPAIEYLSIQLKNSELENIEFEVYNIIGNKIDFDIDMVAHDNYKINVKKFHSGYYLLIVKDQEARFSKAYKFRKQ